MWSIIAVIVCVGPPFGLTVYSKSSAEELQPAHSWLQSSLPLTGQLDGSAKNTTLLTLAAAEIQQRERENIFRVSTNSWCTAAPAHRAASVNFIRHVFSHLSHCEG